MTDGEREQYVSVSEALDDLPVLEAGESADVPDHNCINHRDSTLEKLRETEHGQANHPAYARAYPHEPAFTIVAGKSAPPVHHEQARRCTVRECARLQSFPDWVTFDHLDSRKRKFQLVGNAVPPALAEAIVGELP
jgi:site-specific DNA-cytosine methylase